ncbi:MAG: glutaminase A [Clostridium sp.]|uniref:glutaminase A n=1 Tax=Clostridium sp. TaxID=1506 RepID=UPI002FC99EC6
MKNLLSNIIESNRYITLEGEVANYIPELSKSNKNHLGIYVSSVSGEEYYAGDYMQNFTLQSISKVITLMLAMIDNGKDKVFSVVNVEPSDEMFNSIINLEIKDAKRPLNPMINAGAIATTSLIKGRDYKESFNRILEFTKKITGNPSLTVDLDVYNSESETGYRNRALANFMRSTEVFKDDPDEILDVYFRQCSIKVNTKDVARIGAMLAMDGILPWSGEKVIGRDIARIVKTIMLTCGMYDESGKFSIDVGIPGKSGVSGGILCTAPKRMGIGVYGPSLDSKGNSIAGMEVLKQLSEEIRLSIF